MKSTAAGVIYKLGASGKMKNKLNNMNLKIYITQEIKL